MNDLYRDYTSTTSDYLIANFKASNLDHEVSRNFFMICETAPKIANIISLLTIILLGIARCYNYHKLKLRLIKQKIKSIDKKMYKPKNPRHVISIWSSLCFWIDDHLCCGLCEKKKKGREIYSMKKQQYHLYDMIITKNSSLVQYIINSIETDLLKKVFFQDYQQLLLPLAQSFEIDKNLIDSKMMAYEALKTLDMTKDSVSQKE